MQRQWKGLSRFPLPVNTKPGSRTCFEIPDRILQNLFPRSSIFHLEIRAVAPQGTAVNDFERKISEALAAPQNQGEMADADAVGTVGSPECGDMMRMWLKFSEKDGKKIIDRASFQAFGCQTAIAVASIATQLLKGKTEEEARHMSARELAGDLGALPPMKIHCGQLVEGALRNALDPGEETPATDPKPSLLGDIGRSKPSQIRIVPIQD